MGKKDLASITDILMVFWILMVLGYHLLLKFF